MVKAHITIHLKPGIKDPEADTTLKTLHLLGFASARQVHTTRIWTIDFGNVSAKKAKEEADQVCRRLLTNPVIHDYEVRIE
ncbi:MAG TPA: phosphoribosylformylglycinamidine synthase subunit PurS [Candidatus Thermoplasmatota archaeon]|nr:phosphoribosylformylglycinamidine synthase subunit PurS [Candidatus Thermoplasmatota archaeon]